MALELVRSGKFVFGLPPTMITIKGFSFTASRQTWFMAEKDGQEYYVGFEDGKVWFTPKKNGGADTENSFSVSYP